ncbi:PEP-CTERM sorting domain-containing protein, partial [bacterium]|nr:PEP-CTERM sorting domain-containing protein [bacterium]
TTSTSAGYRGFDIDGDGILDSLQVGDLFHWEMDNGGVDQLASSVGLSLRAGNSSGDATDGTVFAGRRFGFEFQEGNANYQLVDIGGSQDSGIAWRRTGLALDLTLTGADTYHLRVADVASGQVLSNYYGTLRGTAGASMESFVIYNRFAGSDAERDLFFNSFEIYAIPEPSTIFLLGIGGFLAWTTSRRTRRP